MISKLKSDSSRLLKFVIILGQATFYVCLLHAPTSTLNSAFLQVKLFISD